MFAKDDPDLVHFAEMVRAGDVEGVKELLAERPSLATERHGDEHESRTALHIATDWPGHFPRVAETIAVLVDAGAPVDGRMIGSHSETALHWAASSGDLEALDALLAAGADINPSGAVITGGTPLSDAVIFAKWAAARRLVERGATMTIWQAAALGEVEAVAAHLAAGDFSQDDLDNACWHACRTGQLGTARLLVDRGSLVDRPGHEDKTARRLATETGAADLIAFLDGVEDPRPSW